MSRQRAMAPCDPPMKHLMQKPSSFRLPFMFLFIVSCFQFVYGTGTVGTSKSLCSLYYCTVDLLYSTGTYSLQTSNSVAGTGTVLYRTVPAQYKYWYVYRYPVNKILGTVQYDTVRYQNGFEAVLTFRRGKITQRYGTGTVPVQYLGGMPHVL